MYTLEQCEKQWDEAGRHGTIMERLDRTERWMPYYAWLAGEASRAYSPNETARAFVDRLMRTGHLCSGDSVLDIGAGMGGYTLELARHCGSVTALDPSGPCLEVLSARAASAGLENVRTVERPWEKFCPAERYDLVFSAMCPAVCNIEELRRMESLSRRGCCLITVMRGSYDKHRKAMMAELGIGAALLQRPLSHGPPAGGDVPHSAKYLPAAGGSGVAALPHLLPRFRRGGGAVHRFPPRLPGAEHRRRVSGGGELSPLGDDLLGGANGKPMNGIWQINGIISAKSSRPAAFCYIALK